MIIIVIIALTLAGIAWTLYVREYKQVENLMYGLENETMEYTDRYGTEYKVKLVKK